MVRDLLQERALSLAQRHVVRLQCGDKLLKIGENESGRGAGNEQGEKEERVSHRAANASAPVHVVLSEDLQTP